MAISTGSGVILAIGTTASAPSLAQFQADSYTNVGEVEDLGEFGDESEEVRFTSLTDGRVRKLKGPRDAGTIQVVCGDDDNDVGQLEMLAAEANTLDYNFRITLNNKQTLGGTNGIQYFRGKVMSKRLQVGQANNVLRRRFNVGINSAIVEVAST